MRHFSATASLMFLGVLLAGCTPTPPPVDPMSSTPEPTSASSPSEEAAVDRADYGFTYFGLADLGGDWASMSAQLGRTVSGFPECPYYGEVGNTGLVTTYAFIDQHDEAAGVQYFYTMLGSAAAGEPAPRNKEHIGVGSTHDQVLTAFPDAVVSSITDLGAGDIATITVDDPNSDSRYVYGFSGGSDTVDLLQWGPTSGTQWSHLCGGF